MARDARDIALRALRDRAGNVTAALRRMVAEEDLAAADRGLAREIALGVVRRRGTLQTVLRAFLKQPDRKLPSPLEEVFLIAFPPLLIEGLDACPVRVLGIEGLIHRTGTVALE